ncbi:MAG: T9SS type A sorting domain-containing protein [Ignavibacteriaceae bacterium]
MKTATTLFFSLFILSVLSYSQTVYNDVSGDIDPGLATGGGTLDILSMEVSHTATDFIFKLTVNGNVSTTDWGKFMIGIATGNTSGTATGNGWGRPINLDGPGTADMNYWIGSWVDGGGGGQLWSYDNVTFSWVGPGALAGFSFTEGATSTITHTVSHASLGITTAPGTIYFDAYSSGGGESDGAIDALAKPTVTISDWSGSYTSNATTGLLLYTWAVLPVELTSFTATTEKNEVLLIWETATEVNNYGFEVERSLSSHSSSLNGHSLSEVWETIGFVAGSGNSNSVKDYSFTDKKVAAGKYAYRLKQIDNDGTFEYSKEIEVENLQPSAFDLRQNYPNPFNPGTLIVYSLGFSGNVTLKLYDLLGNEVALLVNEQKGPGTYEVKFDASGLASGTYIYRLVAGNFVSTKKMVVLK